MTGEGNGRRWGSDGQRRDDVDPVTERDPETQRSDVAEETEDQANQPGRLAGTVAHVPRHLAAGARRGRAGAKGAVDARAAAAYRKQVVFMLVALVSATAAGLAPPYLAGKAIDDGIRRRGRAGADGHRRRLPRVGSPLLGGDLRCRPTWSGGSASGRCRICASGSTRTCRRCRSASSRGASPGY